MQNVPDPAFKEYAAASNAQDSDLTVFLTAFVFAPSLEAQPKPRPTPNPSPPAAVPDVDFCDIVRRPQRFFNKTVRIKALWQQGNEFSYLTHDRCGPRFRSEIALRVGTANDDVTKTNLGKLREREYGGRAMITAVGTLINPGKYYGYYRYLFQAVRLEDVQHIVKPYEGTLDAGNTYRAVVQSDKTFGLGLVPQVRIEFHYSYRINWINLSEFPELANLGPTSERTIVFSVISSDRRQMTERRWSRTLDLKIIRIE